MREEIESPELRRIASDEVDGTFGDDDIDPPTAAKRLSQKAENKKQIKILKMFIDLSEYYITVAK